MIIKRTLKSVLEETLRSRPAVYLNGPRQAGKSTLAQSLDWDAKYITFDDMNVRLSARRDPQGFIESLQTPVILDEVQYVPELYLPIKKRIDDVRKKASKPEDAAGLFLLTGSTNVMALPDLSKSLVGRISIITLYPLSAGEEENLPEQFLDFCFSDALLKQDKCPEINLRESISKATFPEVASWVTPDYSVDAENVLLHGNWYEDYLQTLIQRDVKAVGEIEKQEEMYRMLQVLAGHAAQLVNETNISRDVGLTRVTYRKYQSLLRQVFLIDFLPPWHSNAIKRIAKSPKVFFNDTMVLCHLLGIDFQVPNPFENLNSGHILENFVCTELTKLISRQAGNKYKLFHFRTNEGKEIDFIIERADRKIVAIEVKSKKTIQNKDLSSLEFMRDNLNEKFVNGIVLYNGTESLSLGDKIKAIPISSLWHAQTG